ncbi:MAG: hypothetical protein AAFY66_18260, partial [Pseudomonadota bacterium]
VRKIVEQHGGTMSLGDGPGRATGGAFDGAQVSLRLPKPADATNKTTKSVNLAQEGRQDPVTGQHERT